MQIDRTQERAERDGSGAAARANGVPSGQEDVKAQAAGQASRDRSMREFMSANDELGIGGLRLDPANDPSQQQNMDKQFKYASPPPASIPLGAVPGAMGLWPDSSGGMVGLPPGGAEGLFWQHAGPPVAASPLDVPTALTYGPVPALPTVLEKFPGFVRCVVDIAPEVVGWVIGRSGSHIKEMKHRSGCGMWVDQKDLKLYITGSDMARIHQAAAMVADLISKAPVNVNAAGVEDEVVSHMIDCPPHLIGLLIGRGGSTIKRIKEESRANVVINQKMMKVIVSGIPESVRLAVAMIEDVFTFGKASDEQHQAIVAAAAAAAAAASHPFPMMATNASGDFIGFVGDDGHTAYAHQAAAAAAAAAAYHHVPPPQPQQPQRPSLPHSKDMANSRNGSGSSLGSNSGSYEQPYPQRRPSPLQGNYAEYEGSKTTPSSAVAPPAGDFGGDASSSPWGSTSAAQSSAASLPAQNPSPYPSPRMPTPRPESAGAGAKSDWSVFSSGLFGLMSEASGDEASDPAVGAGPPKKPVNTEELLTWISPSLARYSSAFQENEVDMDAMKLMGEADFREIGIPKGAAVKIAFFLHTGRRPPGSALTSKISTQQFLANLGLQKYSAAFEEAQVDLAAMTVMREQDFVDMGVVKGPRLKILAELSKIVGAGHAEAKAAAAAASANGNGSSAAAPPPPPASPPATSSPSNSEASNPNPASPAHEGKAPAQTAASESQTTSLNPEAAAIEEPVPSSPPAVIASESS